MLSLLLSLLAPAAVFAGPCVEFDSNFNLYVFGLNGKDVNVGAQSSWNSPNPQAIATSGRPPFDGTNTQCFLSQYNNAIYILGADNANPANVYIYDATDNSWSMSVVTTAGVDPNSVVSILDHDTNVFYALSGGNLYQLDYSTITKTATGPTAWEAVEAPNFQTTGYKPVMAIAQNHIHFLDVPGNQAGQANIFVIHFSYFQPEVQSYPAASGSQTFPETHGQVTSFFDPNNLVQQQFAFIPDDNSAVYIVNVENNSTISLTGPTDTTASTFAASTSALVQLTSSGSVYYMPFGQANPGAQNTWTLISNFGTAASGSNGSSNGTTSQTGASQTAHGSSTASPSGSGSSSSPSAGSAKGGAAGLRISGQTVFALGAIALGAALFL
ncbi:hypothetical protein DACRYDRAFT_23912 [Dacryopinax primogenitus]|uniref:Uncharacterized protein n=1 Tax=Dacryopinax primogenitus (strain DJM 731) TaxID=1858805 RepID=M5FQU9_DACPD|nr:uncharacterized protein DACRYDRAFT_23912 [Dacryopinax primogenitus]EJT99355.1 hypothetical protein DACRYDRAFT_23912 [Dacryopinax primogenitus]